MATIFFVPTDQNKVLRIVLVLWSNPNVVLRLLCLNWFEKNNRHFCQWVKTFQKIVCSCLFLQSICRADETHVDKLVITPALFGPLETEQGFFPKLSKGLFWCECSLNQGSPTLVLGGPYFACFNISLLQHIWFEWSAHQQALKGIWISCVGEGKYHAKIGASEDCSWWPLA